jgi:aminopeptidase N
LNEGFASYNEHIGADFIEPNGSAADLFPLDNIHLTLDIDALESSHPVSVEVFHPDEINDIFDTITYLKGSSVIRKTEFR